MVNNKNSNITKISISNILKIKRHKYFDETVLYSNKINEILQNKVKILMLNAKINNSTETLMLIENSTMRHILACDNDYNNVNFSDKMILELKNIDNVSTFTAIHNHPNNTNFSIKDLITFIDKGKLAYIMVCTNDCKNIGILGKTNIIDANTQVKMIKYINDYMNKNGLDEHSPADKLIQFFMTKGLLYAVYKNY